MPHFVQAFENGRWCIDHEPYVIEQGMIVRFSRKEDAAHFVNLGRAGYIGEFNSFDQARADLIAIHEEMAAAEAARKAAEGEANAGSQTGAGGDAGDGESHGETAPAPGPAAAPKPAKSKAKAQPPTA